jgi:hypothetical protein
MTVSDSLEQPCNKSDNAIREACYKLLTTSLFQICYNSREQPVRKQLVDSLLADSLQDVRFLRVHSVFI